LFRAYVSRITSSFGPNAYVIKIKEIEMATGEVMINQFLAIGPEDKLRSLRGTKTVDPTYGLTGSLAFT
jgi:flagellar biosynthesis component FlhA